MKKFLILAILLTLPLLAFGQTITADSPAVDPTFMDSAIQAGYAFLAILLNFFALTLAPMLQKYLKGKAHNKYADVITDSFFEALTEMTAVGKAILADGIVTDAEKAEFNAAWKKISKDKLLRLSGFAKADVDAWVDEQMKVTLGKLLARILG